MCGNRQKRGLILVAVLWTVVLLTAIAAVVSQMSRLETKMSFGRLEQTRCKWACRAGTETALALLMEDERTSDCLSDLWSDNDEDLNDVAMEGCSFRVRVIDEASKLNINVLSKEQLMTLPYMEEDIADSILDWRDKDDTPGAEGAESGYYENLPFAYKTRNGPFQTLRELLLVKGVTDELFYGEDTNLNGLLDENERDGDKSPPMDDGDDELDEGWIAYLTCQSYENNVAADGSQRTNINSASQQQLEKTLGISRNQAQWIVQNRPQGGYKSVADLITSNTAAKPQQQSSGQNTDQAQALDMQTFRGIVDKITIASAQKIPGKVNVNTAGEHVLTVFLGDDEAARELALNIISYRESLLSGFESVGDVLDVTGVSAETFKKIADAISVRSDVYTIYCDATAGTATRPGARLLTEAVVDRSVDNGTILYWYQGAGY